MNDPPLTQLIYTSRLNFDASTREGWKRVEDIVSGARERNREAGITGFLIVGTDWAAQILEGAQTDVSRTLQRILSDPRHADVKLLDMRLVKARCFEGWTMGASARPLKEISLETFDPGKNLLSPPTFDAILARAQLEAQTSR